MKNACLLVLLLAGTSSIGYGLWLMWEPLVYLVGGLAAVAYVIGDESKPEPGKEAE